MNTGTVGALLGLLICMFVYFVFELSNWEMLM